MDEFYDEEIRDEGRGRTARKREAKAVEKLAERLAGLPEAELAGLPLSGQLAGELLQVRQTKGHSSRKRQLKYFSGLLRRDDDAREALQQALGEIEMQHNQDAAAHHDLETLRDRLCSVAEHETAMREVATKFPSVDRNALQRLINSVQQHSDKRAFREIFRRLRDAQP